MSINDLVSVIIPTFGRPTYLKNAILSALHQSHQNLEVLVIDDNDPQSNHRLETERIINNINDKRIIYIKHDYNKNGAVARNTGIYAAQGDFITFLDDDDEYLDNKIEVQLHALKENPSYSAVYCPHFKYYNNQLVYASTYNKSGNCQLDVLKMISEIHTSSLLFDKNSILAIDGFDESFTRHQDFEFLIRYFEFFSAKYIPQVLLKIHIDSGLNRPNVEKLINAKNNYFIKLEHIINKYSSYQINEIYKAHNLELFRVCFKNFDLRMFRYFLKSKPNLKDIYIYILPVAKKTVNKIRVKANNDHPKYSPLPKRNQSDT